VPTAHGGTEPRAVRSTADRDRAAPRRVIVVPGGPVLVEGPVEIALADGSTVVCDRFMVAICACRRSGRYPLCDTSHRRTRAYRDRDGTSGGDVRR
jgi:CDGSH-type Zn-finger protein